MIMEKDLKDLLLRDLCARLPYGVKISKTIENFISNPHSIRSINSNNVIIEDGEFEDGTPDIDVWDIENVKPYLFPLSSMTEGQEVEYDATFATIVYEDGRKDSVMTYKSFDWLNKNHFDYRGLIPMELAIDATGLNIY